MLEYPWGVTGGVGIKREDFDRLKPGVYLNDNLIEFGLRYNNWDKINLRLTKTFMSSVLFDFVFHVTTDVLKHCVRKYDDVRRWTSKIDIFAMTYLIIPIHEGIHWYLAIICNPGCMILPAEPEKETEVEGEERSDTGKGSAEGEIFTLDSLSSEHQDTLTALSNFLVLEASDKKGVQTTRQPITQSASVSVIMDTHRKLTIVQVPRQRNSYDCGIYLIHFAETFMSEPSRYHKLMVGSCLWSNMY
ncbi:cysteine proteinase [Armillaria solidipes]|uniref:Cysteine proteinase n=1 Tax=Armillaria solidipes TaxID=1076256 RepID=A0A2H3B8N7_9AGAR|nr:cysteine proteinase [Armillaria solidipes]